MAVLLFSLLCMCHSICNVVFDAPKPARVSRAVCALSKVLMCGSLAYMAMSGAWLQASRISKSKDQLTWGLPRLRILKMCSKSEESCIASHQMQTCTSLWAGWKLSSSVLDTDGEFYLLCAQKLHFAAAVIALAKLLSSSKSFVPH